MIRGFVWPFVASLPIALVGLIAAASAPRAVQAQSAPQAVIMCPATQPRVPIDVCVDRGDGALYLEGDPILICVTVTNLTAVPFRFSVRLTNYVNGVFQGVLLEESMDSGQRCIKGVIGPPFGKEEIRADLLRPDGSVYASDSVFYATAPRPGPPPTTLSIGVNRGEGAVYHLSEGIRVCYTVPGAGQITITDRLPDGRRQVLVAGFDDGTGGCFWSLVTPPTGWECLRLDFAGTSGSGSRQTCFLVTS